MHHAGVPHRLHSTVHTAAQHVSTGRQGQCNQAASCHHHLAASCDTQVWFEYSRWHADAGGGLAQATACLVRGVTSLPDCLLLHFALADLHEAQGNVDAAREVGTASSNSPMQLHLISSCFPHTTTTTSTSILHTHICRHDLPNTALLPSPSPPHLLGARKKTSSQALNPFTPFGG
jgi:hypothetical protein